MLNRIHRQILDIELPRESRAYALQQQVGQAYQEKLLPRLDEIFSALVPEDIILRIPNLEIDLGELNEAHWEQEFVERCVDQVRRQILDLSNEHAKEGSEKKVEWIQPEENASVVFKSFLQSGVLPWYARHLSICKLEELMSTAVSDNPVEIKKQFPVHFLQDQAIWKRLNWQFSQNFVTQLVSLSKGLTPQWVHDVAAVYKEQRKVQMSEQQYYLLLEAILASDIKEKHLGQPDSGFIHQLFRQAFKEDRKSGDTKRPASLKSDRGVSDVQGQKNKQPRPQSPERPVPLDKTSEGKQDAEAVGKDTESQANGAGQGSDTTEPFDNPAIARPNNITIPEEGLMVDFSGIVLLGVYLEMFFKELGLVREKYFESEEKQIRAIHLLHFLATDEVYPEEHVLTLPKVLCGVPVDYPIPQQLELREEEKAECLNLLNAAVRNWPALKSTSPEGLREGFLRREGILYPPITRSMWALNVERKAQDFLMDRLPWGFATLKLPWMKKPIQTTW